MKGLCHIGKFPGRVTEPEDYARRSMHGPWLQYGSVPAWTTVSMRLTNHADASVGSSTISHTMIRFVAFRFPEAYFYIHPSIHPYCNTLILYNQHSGNQQLRLRDFLCSTSRPSACLFYNLSSQCPLTSTYTINVGAAP